MIEEGSGFRGFLRLRFLAVFHLTHKVRVKRRSTCKDGGFFIVVLSNLRCLREHLTTQIFNVLSLENFGKKQGLLI